MSRFINAELKSDSHSESHLGLEPDLEAESKSDNELMAKLKSDSDSLGKSKTKSVILLTLGKPKNLSF